MKKFINKSVSYILGLLLILLSVYNYRSSEFVFGDEALRSQFYFVFFALVAFVLCYMLFVARKRKMSSTVLISLLFTIYLGVKCYLYPEPAQYDVLSVAYSFFWFLLMFFANNYFLASNDRQQDSRFINICFYVYIVVSLLNIESFIKYSEYGIPMMPLVYNSLYFLPWILMMGKVKRTFSLLLLFLMVAISAKRGAVVVMACEILVLSFIYLNLRSSRKIYYVLTLFAVALIAGYSIEYANTINDNYILSRFDVDALQDGSGRSDIYKYGFEAINDMSSIKQLLLGYDLGSKILIDFGGHNDWITYMLYHGIIGLGLYVALYISMFKNILKLRAANNKLYIPYISLFIIMFVLSCVSSAYNPVLHPIMGMLFIGFVESKTIKIDHEKSCNTHIYKY